MSNFKDDFIPGTPILSTEINQNFNRLNNLFHLENLTSQVDGIKTQFTTTYNYMPGLLMVYIDGLLATPQEDYQEDGNNKFTLLMEPLEIGTKLVVFYIRKF